MSEPESESESESKSEPESESVTEPVIIIGIRLNSDKAKKNYIVGDELDVTGLILEVSWSDGSEEKIDVTKDMVTGFDSKTVGKQTLTVTYKDWAGVYEVEVNAEGNKNGAVIPTTAPKDGSIEDELIVNEMYNLGNVQ